LAEISRPNLARLRLVPISTVAPTGPVTAPPDEIIEHPAFDMLHAEMNEFARCIRDNRPYPISIEQVLHGMAVFDAVVRSAKSGKVETVEV
jgi:predicted dehydrogenase